MQGACQTAENSPIHHRYRVNARCACEGKGRRLTFGALALEAAALHQATPTTPPTPPLDELRAAPRRHQPRERRQNDCTLKGLTAQAADDTSKTAPVHLIGHPSIPRETLSFTRQSETFTGAKEPGAPTSSADHKAKRRRGRSGNVATASCKDSRISDFQSVQCSKLRRTGLFPNL